LAVYSIHLFANNVFEMFIFAQFGKVWLNMCGGTDEEHTGPQRLTIESLTEDESNAC
jgi:hypothetical protein